MTQIVQQDPTPETSSEQHGRHHDARPGAVTVADLVARHPGVARPSTNGGRHHAGLVTTSARVLARMVGGVL